ncbi:hypothetical protein EVAR_42409_1 [Eumeta japonica]|uniref:Uncharacterized protein n=1 Tax=Eumeta variegata TaxID=151549 RepID=A0A4C1XAT9_EUMVA|nr:hypothetical protein EVAR_42409_1 [Eumeta japonica]
MMVNNPQFQQGQRGDRSSLIWNKKDCGKVRLRRSDPYATTTTGREEAVSSPHRQTLSPTSAADDLNALSVTPETRTSTWSFVRASSRTGTKENGGVAQLARGEAGAARARPCRISALGRCAVFLAALGSGCGGRGGRRARLPDKTEAEKESTGADATRRRRRASKPSFYVLRGLPAYIDNRFAELFGTMHIGIHFRQI